jgi:hypothetical protein
MYICMYIKAVADSLILLLNLWNEFCNVVFTIRLILESGSAPSPEKNSGCSPYRYMSIIHNRIEPTAPSEKPTESLVKRRKMLYISAGHDTN